MRTAPGTLAPLPRGKPKRSRACAVQSLAALTRSFLQGSLFDRPRFRRVRFSKAGGLWRQPLECWGLTQLWLSSLPIFKSDGPRSARRVKPEWRHFCRHGGISKMALMRGARSPIVHAHRTRYARTITARKAKAQSSLRTKASRHSHAAFAGIDFRRSEAECVRDKELPSSEFEVLSSELSHPQGASKHGREFHCACGGLNLKRRTRNVRGAHSSGILLD